MLKRRPNPFVAALLLMLWACAVVTHAEPIDFSQIDPAEHTFDHWYLDTIDSQAAGYWRSAMTIEDNHLVSVYHQHRVESHGGERSTYSQRIVWTETKDFKPITVIVTTDAGSDTVTKTYRYLEDGIELTSEQNGRLIKRKLPHIDGDYLTAAQASIATDLYLKRGIKQFKLNTLDLSVGLKPFVTTYTRRDEAQHTLKQSDGVETQASLWATTYSILPGFEVKTWVNDAGHIVGVAYNVDEMTFDSRLADASVVDHTFDPPEMAGLSVVVPDKPLKRIHQQRKIVYELSYDAGDHDIIPVSAAQQTVQRLGQGNVRLTIDLDSKPQAYEQDRPTAAHMASSIMIDHKDEVVRALAREAIAKIGESPTQERIAQACKRQVTRHLTGVSLAVGDGSASEAARTREGDCTESAVLLAALLRANNIPSRCVSGLVYSEDDFVGHKDVFVYHMWTQAWIDNGQGDGHWLDLDAAMWRYSAGHIAMGVSAMGDDDQQDLIQLVPMQQKLQINVKETYTKNQR